MESTGSCVVCGSSALRTVLSRTFSPPETGDDDYVSIRLRCLFEELAPRERRSTFDVENCGDCGMLFSNPRLSPEEVARKYGYISAAQKSHPVKRPSRYSERSERICREISRARGGRPAGLRVLDYGGAQGFNLTSFAGSNRCYLVDYQEYDPLPGIEYLGQDLRDLEGQPAFDIILFTHVLEHVPRPVEFLRGLASILSAGGLLYVEVPLGSFRDYRLFAEPLTHVNFFSERSMSRCMEEAGVPVVSLATGFQWVTDMRQWCINVVGRRGPGEGRTRRAFQGNRWTRNSWRYLRWGADRAIMKARGMPR